jgi:hypothetical protein
LLNKRALHYNYEAQSHGHGSAEIVVMGTGRLRWLRPVVALASNTPRLAGVPPVHPGDRQPRANCDSAGTETEI